MLTASLTCAGVDERCRFVSLLLMRCRKSPARDVTCAVLGVASVNFPFDQLSLFPGFAAECDVIARRERVLRRSLVLVLVTSSRQDSRSSHLQASLSRQVPTQLDGAGGARYPLPSLSSDACDSVGDVMTSASVLLVT